MKRYSTFNRLVMGSIPIPPTINHLKKLKKYHASHRRGRWQRSRAHCLQTLTLKSVRCDVTMGLATLKLQFTGASNVKLPHILSWMLLPRTRKRLARSRRLDRVRDDSSVAALAEVKGVKALADQ